MKALKDVSTTEKYRRISLKLLTGQKIVDVTGYVTEEFGQHNFKICNIVLEDGTKLGVGGEHDLPYIEDDIPGGDEEQLQAFLDEEDRV